MKHVSLIIHLALASLLVGLPLAARAAVAPASGSAVPAGPAAIALYWSDEATDETGYELQREDGGWETIATLPANTVYYYDRGLGEETTHRYRVRTLADSGNSDWLELGSATTTMQMNILFVFADDMGYKDIVALRNRAIDGPTIYQTPALDTLISQSVTFENAYASGPKCVVARRAVLTGNYDWRPEVVPTGGGIALANVTYGEAAKTAGYRTCYIGKYHLGDAYSDTPARGPAQQGFDVSIAAGEFGAPPVSYFPQPVGGGNYSYSLPDLADTDNPKEYLADRLTDEAIGFMQDSITHFATQPFFVTLAHYVVHTPVEAKQEDIDYFTARKQAMAAELATHPMAGTPLLTDYSSNVRQIQDNRVYAAMMKSYDDSIASLRAWLASTDDPRHPGRNLSETTILVVSSDHGGKSGSEIVANKRLENDATDAYAFDGSNTSYSYYPTSNYPFRQGKTWVYEGGLKIPLIVHYPGLTPTGTRTRAFVHGADFFASFADMAGAAQQPSQARDSVSFLLPAATPQAASRTESYHFFLNASTGTANPALGAYREGDYKLMYHIIRHNTELYNIAADPYERDDLATSRPDLVQEMLHRLYRSVIASGETLPKPTSNSWKTELQVLTENGLIPTVPAVPDAAPTWTGAGATQISPTTVELQWNVNASNADWSIIYRRANAEGESAFREYASIPAGVITFRDYDLIPGGQYLYYVESANLGGWASGNTGSKTLTLEGGLAPLQIHATDDAITTVPGEKRGFYPLLNDEGEGALHIVSITQPTSGNATFDDQRIYYHAPDGFSGTGVTMTYTVMDDAAQTDTATVTITLPLQLSSSDLGTWQFNETTGAALEDTTCSTGLQFAGPTTNATTNAGNLTILSGGSDLNQETGVVQGSPYTSGKIRMEFRVSAMDFTAAAPVNNNASFGFGLRDDASNTDFGTVRVREQNGKLRFEIRTSSNNPLHDFDGTTLTDLTVVTLLDLDNRTFSTSYSIDGGANFTQVADVAATVGANAFNTIRITSSQLSSWGTGDFVSIDFLKVSRLVNQASLYDSWTTTHPWHGILDRGPDDDPDRDGLPNLLEFAFGLPPTEPDENLPLSIVPQDASLWLQLTPARDTDLIHYGVQFSSDLADWASIPEFLLDSPAGETVLVELPDPPAFARVRVKEE